jgi:hypothetical protein
MRCARTDDQDVGAVVPRPDRRPFDLAFLALGFLGVALLAIARFFTAFFLTLALRLQVTAACISTGADLARATFFLAAAVLRS